VPPLRGRVQLLGRWRELEVPDPYGQEKAVFESVFEQIDDCVADWLPRLA
jgi:protein-tyrosine phosphatase